MSGFGKRLLRCGAAQAACAVVLPWAVPANADSDLTLNAFELNGDLRLVAVDGERSWVDGGFGKLRSGSDGHLKLQPQLGNASLVWKPQLGWSLGAVMVGEVQGGQRTDAGLSQAYLTYRAMRGSKIGFSARAGLMWPPVSLEHEGADWHVKDSITPSAINSWIGEEVRPVAAEATVTAELGASKLRATAAVMAANDTAGTLLTFRGWALHDRTTLAFRRQPLPPFDGPIAFIQAPFTHPLLDIAPGFASRPGYYAKLSWQAPVPLRIELFRYDNRANPEVVNSDLEWGWRTAFTHVGAVAELGSGAELKVQALQGRTRMGYPDPLKRFVDERFRAGYALLTKPVGIFVLTGRVDAFGTRNRGSDVGAEYYDTGWSAMLAARRDWTHFTGIVELLHVSSKRSDRDEAGLAPRQEQTQLQAEVRMHW